MMPTSSFENINEFAQTDLALASMPVAAFRADLQGFIRYANGAAENLFDLTFEDFVGRRYDEPAVPITDIHGNPLDFQTSPIPRALSGENVHGFEARIWHASKGESRTICFDSAPLKKVGGTIVGAVVVARDVTEVTRDREALIAIQQRLHGVLNNTRMAVFLMDERQHCVYANAAAEALTGYRCAEMQGRPLHDVVHHTRPDGSHYPLQDCPIDRAFPEDFQVEGEEVFVHRDGSFYPVAFTASPIRDNTSRTIGTVIEVRGIAQERQLAQERLELEDRFRNMADHAPVMMWVTDANGICTYLNKSWYEFTGQTEEQALGAGWLDAVHPDDRAWSQQTFHDANNSHTSFRLEYRLRRADGMYRWCIDAASPRFSGADKFLGYIGSVLDIDDRHEAESRLRETEERHRLALAATQDAVWDWDLRAKCRTWNEALGSAHGWPLSSVDTHEDWWLQRIHENDRARVEENIQTVIRGPGVRWNAEYRFQRADGTFADIYDRGSVLHDETGRPVRVIGAMLDQTEQKRQQAALRESELMLRRLTDAMPAMAWVTTAAGEVMWFNAKWYTYVGTPVGSDLGTAWIQYLHPDDRAAAVTRWQQAVTESRSFENEHRFRGADGTFRWFLARGTPIHDATGSISRWFGTCTDIQEIVEARNVLRRSREELAREVELRTRELDRVWSISKDLYLVCGRDFICRQVNPAWQSALGYEPAGLVGQCMDLFFPPDDWSRLTESLSQDDLDCGRDIDIRLRAKDSALRWYSWHWRAEGDFLYAFGRDISSRVALELQLRQAQKMETVGKLTGGVAHDFNNLLQVISGNLQLLSRHVAGNAFAELRVKNALAGVGRGAKLASQLLAFGRRQPLEPKVIHVGRLIQQMDDMLRRTLGEGVEVETVVSGGLWNAFADPTQLENAVLNLAINARDAMDAHGKLTIESSNAFLDDVYCRQHPECSPGQYVLLAVTDTGCGMTPEVAAQVFEPFYSTKPEGKGTGLGLSMVYGFIKQSGGHVKIYTEPGLGTTVKLYLPRSLAALEEAQFQAVGPARGGTETVLVAEDDEEVRATAVDILKSFGYRVLEATDATGAMAVINSGQHVDLLFTDVVMPGKLRSPDLARKARERLPGIAVLFTSGYTENAIVHGGRLDPGVELLSKPYTQEALAHKIRHVLANQQQRNRILGLGSESQSVDTPASPPPLHPHSASSDSAHARNATGFSIMLVEDDDLIRSGTTALLRAMGHEVMAAANASEAERLLSSGGFDFLVTDVALPDGRGEKLAVQARQTIPKLAVVFATGSDDVEEFLPDAVVLRKPFDIEALNAALSSALSRIQANK